MSAPICHLTLTRDVYTTRGSRCIGSACSAWAPHYEGPDARKGSCGLVNADGATWNDPEDKQYPKKPG